MDGESAEMTPMLVHLQSCMEVRKESFPQDLAPQEHMPKALWSQQPSQSKQTYERQDPLTTGPFSYYHVRLEANGLPAMQGFLATPQL